ncbi:MAG: hypothetical protein EXS59_02065 [Candidatus Taylorbacteria bacterium]|nr:hypothetical protein [Candidatus Taylorbacteria bacterium]
MLKKYLSSSVALSFLPAITFALAPTRDATDAFSLIRILQNIVDAVIPFIIGLGILVLIYGIFNFISSAGDEEARAGAKQLIIWGVIGIFVMVSVWGLVNILMGTFFKDGSTLGPISIPSTYAPSIR